MIRRPLIGVTTSEVRDLEKSTEQGEPPQREMTLGLPYLKAVELAGGIPVVLPPLHEDAIPSLVEHLDGLCLSGGPDIHPYGYESEPGDKLGPTWPGGVDVSFGQWQKLALARGFMRDEPLVLVLDEPTAALDAETEHALFERYAAAVRGRAENGRITILVSHRFSTVRMADLIVVLDGSRVAEVGSHDALLAKGGQYAQLYGIQAAAYR